MGIDVQASIVVGLPRKEVEDLLADRVEGDFQGWVEGEGLSSVAPYYDGSSDAVIGVAVYMTPRYSASEVEVDDMLKAVADAQVRFKKLVGADAKVYLTPNVW